MTTTLNDRQDRDWLEDVLRADAREHAAAYVADEGFTARVVGTLPDLQPVPRWRKPAVRTLWGVAAAGTVLTLPNLAIDVGREAFSLLAAQPVSLPNIIATLAVLGIATWAAAAMALRAD